VVGDQGVCCIVVGGPRPAPPPPPPPRSSSSFASLCYQYYVMPCRAGPCCQLDKIACDHHSLLEAMEQQRVSVAKSGVVTSLRRCPAATATRCTRNGAPLSD
jgi:hypothetical protein